MTGSAVHRFDLHDGALYAWRKAAVRHRTLVHIDAHHDLDRPTDDTINIGNFVRCAIREQIVSCAFWVVPDPMWRDERTRRWLTAELGAAGAAITGEHAGRVEADVEGCLIHVGTLDSLPVLAEPVLLDIDLDFLLMAERHEHTPLWPLDVPWSWPDELVRRIRELRIPFDVVTIATSVTGGFAPIAWQHLAREIAMRLDGTGDAARLACFAALRDAADHRASRRLDDAMRASVQAIEWCPDEAAAHFHHAELLCATGDPVAAQEAFRQALDIDSSYRHPFRTRAPWFIDQRRWQDAIDVYDAALVLDPDDPHARLGLAMARLEQGHAGEALTLAQISLASVDSIEGWRTAARASAALGDRPGAIAACRRAIAAALRGACPLTGPWSSNPDGRLADPSHWQDHALLAQLLGQAGDYAGALAHERIAARARGGARLVRL